MNLTQNTILITGGNSGIGLALAQELKKLGNDVLIAGRSKEKNTQVQKLGFKTFEIDMSSTENIDEFANKVIREHPSLNAVIHCAGIMKNENLKLGQNRSTILETISTNVFGTLLLNDALIPHLLKQKHATIMTVTSGLAFAPLTMTPTYCASKAAIHSYTESLRHQLRDTSVEVIELIPPYVQTSLMGDRQAKDPMAMPLADFISEVMSILRSNPSPKEIAVERVKPQRLSSYQGQEKYEAFFEQLNERLWNARRDEFPR